MPEATPLGAGELAPGRALDFWLGWRVLAIGSADEVPWGPAGPELGPPGTPPGTELGPAGEPPAGAVTVE